jgi:hypothetical protein
LRLFRTLKASFCVQEWGIVKSLPWDKVDISVISLEFFHLANKEEVVNFMKSVGYDVHSVVEWDTIYVKRNLSLH